MQGLIGSEYWIWEGGLIAHIMEQVDSYNGFYRRWCFDVWVVSSKTIAYGKRHV